MASGHVNRTQRPNTWLHRPSLRREDSPCQLGAVHTWHKADMPDAPTNVADIASTPRSRSTPTVRRRRSATSPNAVARVATRARRSSIPVGAVMTWASCRFPSRSPAVAAPIMHATMMRKLKTVMREPARKCQKEWSFEPPMCTVDHDQLHLSVQSGLCAWRSAPEQQIAIQRQGEWCLSPCHKLRPLPLSRRDQRPCSDEQMVESVPLPWIPSPGPRHRF
jgi:hypothetical protein